MGRSQIALARAATVKMTVVGQGWRDHNVQQTIESVIPPAEKGAQFLSGYSDSVPARESKGEGTSMWVASSAIRATAR